MIIYLIRLIMFLVKGFLEFSRQGYEKNSKSFNKEALNVNCENKLVIITDASNGIGKIAAIEIAKRGAKVLILSRNKEKGEEALKEIKEKSKNYKIELFIVDMSDLKSIKKFTETFLRESMKKGELKCDAVILSTGCIVKKKEITKEGLDLGFVINTLGPYYLIKMLMPTLQKTKGSRVITVSSGGMYIKRLNPNDIQMHEVWKYDPILAYSENKRQIVELTKRWSEVYSNSGIKFFSMHPGWAKTPDLNKQLPNFSYYFNYWLRTSEQGADTIIWLAISKEVENYANGSFFFDRKLASTNLPYCGTECKQEEVDSLIMQCNKLLEMNK